MIRSIISPIWVKNLRFPLSTNGLPLRRLHHKTKIFDIHRRYQSVLQYQQLRGTNGKKDKDESKVSTLFKPVAVSSNRDDINIGAELTGKLDKVELLKVLNKFTQKPEIKLLCTENGLDG